MWEAQIADTASLCLLILLYILFTEMGHTEREICRETSVHPTQTTKNQVVDLQSTGPKSENLGIYSSE